MFLQTLLERNRPLAELGLKWQQQGKILPDTYLLDLDTICQNAAAMKAEADKYGIRLYFMLKQIGRNPVVAKALMDIGFAGAVCVDYREALTMIENHIPVGNVGHLVQVPTAAMDRIVAARPDIMTVYTLDKVRQIGESAQKHAFVQPIMLRVLDQGDMLYSGTIRRFLAVRAGTNHRRNRKKFRVCVLQASAPSLAFCMMRARWISARPHI